jgi:hypothetical protein
LIQYYYKYIYISKSLFLFYKLGINKKSFLQIARKDKMAPYSEFEVKCVKEIFDMFSNAFPSSFTSEISMKDIKGLLDSSLIQTNIYCGCTIR